jgi:sortase A
LSSIPLETPAAPEALVAPRSRKRHVRRLGKVFVLGGIVLLVYAATILLWRDPLTDVYARYQQHRLDSSLASSFTLFTREFEESATAAERQAIIAAKADVADVAAKRAAVAAAARRVRATVQHGDALGRLVIPKLSVDPVFVHGTRWAQELSKGPGHYERTTLPGLDKVVAIAGHRTTFGAPFRHIDDLEAGDSIRVEMAYGTFDYRVFAHEIVRDDNWSILRPRGFDTLVLSACHPLYGSSHRWIVYARLAAVEDSPVGDYRLPTPAAPA